MSNIETSNLEWLVGELRESRNEITKMNSLYEWRGEELDMKGDTIDGLKLQIEELEAKIRGQAVELCKSAETIDLREETLDIAERTIAGLDKQIESFQETS